MAVVDLTQRARTWSPSSKRLHAILATTDLQCAAVDVIKMYQGRYQIEFLFRNGKQFAGPTDCQARNEATLDFHFNAVLATVSATRAAMVGRFSLLRKFF